MSDNNRNQRDGSIKLSPPSPMLATSTSSLQVRPNLPNSQISITFPPVPTFEHDLVPTISSDLASKLAGDVLTAFGVTFGITPFMAVIDKAIIQRAAGTHSIVQSSLSSIISMASNPVAFVKSPMFLMMWGVYATTYTTANCLKTIAEHQDHFQDKKTKNNESSDGIGTLGTFVATTVVNSSTSMLKDRFYASQFGTSAASGVPAKIPKITYGLFAMRDCMVIGSSFILPDILCGVIQEHSDLDRDSALKVSQLACPILAQGFVGPVQLLGLDIYNRPLAGLSTKDLFMERFRFQCANFSSIFGARVSRIAPAYGLGGIGNTYFRDMWRNRLLRQERGSCD
mmetsp:Transcript_19981/g.29203  ORF Transcript_19981/g.29203 Transcript_19981/m.29203 type:complete len:341 (-) Transcript_19981:157-1179(-)